MEVSEFSRRAASVADLLDGVRCAAKAGTAQSDLDHVVLDTSEVL
jgi:hypothetical protein